MTGRRRRHDAGGDAGHRDDRPARPARPRDRRRAGGGRRQPCAAGAVRPRQAEVVDRLDEAEPRARRRRRTRRAPGRCAAAQRHRGPPARRQPPPRAAARPASRPGLPVLVRARAVHPGDRPPRRRPGRRGAGRRTGRRRDADARQTHDRSTRRPGSTPCWRARRWSSCCGSGGVGKTTIAAALGLAAAVEQGGKVLVLTVDPARRLADALGVGALGNTPTRVPDATRSRPPASSRAASCGRRCSTPRPAGTSSSAATRPTRQVRDAVLANPLYQNITSRFVHSHDYLAMEQLHDLHATGEYDLVVVDTPPSRNALSCSTRRPDGRLLRQPAAAVADRAVPVAAVHRGVEAVLPDRRPGARLAVPAGHRRLLRALPGDGERASSRGPGRSRRCSVDPRTTFVVVTTLETAPAHEAGYLARELLAPRLSTSVRSSPTASCRRPDAARERRASARRSSTGPTGALARDAARASPGVSAESGRAGARRGRRPVPRRRAGGRREAERRAELAALAPMLLSVPSLERTSTTSPGWRARRSSPRLIAAGSTPTSIRRGFGHVRNLTQRASVGPDAGTTTADRADST